MYAIESDRLTKRFGSFTAVDSISFNVKKGEIFGFLGANGAGKSTAIRMYCGLLMPTEGSAKVVGYDIYRESEMIKRNIGYMSQRFSLFEDLTVKENMRFYGGVYGLSRRDVAARTKELLSRLNLSGEHGTMVKEIPLGIRQKLSFATSMIHKPKIIFLDEPTGGVDPITRRQFWELIYETAAEGTTIFVTTHYMDEAEYCNRVSMMVSGKMVDCDTPHNLKERHNVPDMDSLFVKLSRE